MKKDRKAMKKAKGGNRFRAKGAALYLALLLMGGCGGGGESGAPAALNTAPAAPALAAQSASFKLTGDDYGIESATYLSATKSGLGIVLRAALASSMSDPAFRNISRIDIAPGAAIIAQGGYTLGGTGNFPGSVYFFDGHQSTLLRTTGGSITFNRYGSNSGDRISGSFSAVVEDGNDPSKHSYTIAADFDFIVDASGPVLPAPASLALSGEPPYQAHCAFCHALGSFDPTSAGGPDLALKGGVVGTRFSPGQPGHQGVTLSAGEIEGMKVLLNVN
jgi:hypothetical protein